MCAPQTTFTLTTFSLLDNGVRSSIISLLCRATTYPAWNRSFINYIYFYRYQQILVQNFVLPRQFQQQINLLRILQQ